MTANKCQYGAVGLCLVGDLHLREIPQTETPLQTETTRTETQTMEPGIRQPDRKWHHTETETPPDRQTPVKTLPALAVGNDDVPII